MIEFLIGATHVCRDPKTFERGEDVGAVFFPVVDFNKERR